MKQGESQGKKAVVTTLDILPDGGDKYEELRTGKVKKAPLPEGVSHGMLVKDVVFIAWPCLLELVLTQLTSIANQIMVGRLDGDAGIIGLAAVGLAAQPKFLLMTMIQAMNVGATAIIARSRGQQNRERANQVFKQALFLNLILAFAFMVVGIIWAEPLIRFMGGTAISEETIAQSVNYFLIQMYGFVPLAMTFTVTAALRGIGDTKTPLIYNTTANIVNAVFSFFLIYGKGGLPRMGVTGASIATVTGQTIAFAIGMIVILRKKHYVYFSFKEKFVFDKILMNNVLQVGFPSMLEQLFMRAGMIIYGRTVASLGDTLFATHQVCMSIQAMSFMMGQAFANAATTLMGQSLGKRRYDMAQIYMRETRLIGVIVSMALAVVLIIFNKGTVALYNSDAEVITVGSQILILIALSQPIQAEQFIISGGLRGAGDTKYVAIVMLITVLGIRSILGVIAVNVLHWGLWGAWIALMADQCMRTILMIKRYYSGKWRQIKFKGEKESLSATVKD